MQHLQPQDSLTIHLIHQILLDKKQVDSLNSPIASNKCSNLQLKTRDSIFHFNLTTQINALTLLAEIESSSLMGYIFLSVVEHARIE